MTGALFTQYELEGVNALTAGSFDASTSFQAHDPASHLIYSLGVFGRYFSPEPNSRPNAIKVNAEGGAPSDVGDCRWYDLGCQVSRVLTSEPVNDFFKRTALLILAVVLIAVAVWKL